MRIPGQQLVSQIGRRWGGAVYAAMVPIRDGVPAGAADFLADVWRLAPRRIAAASTAAVLFIAFSPPIVLRRLALFHQLDADAQQRLLTKLLRARPYLVRMLVAGVKAQALVAVLRDGDTRAALQWERQ